MSSFVVTNRTIESVLFSIYRLNDVWLTYDLRTTKGMNELGQALVNLNYEAVNYRYNENDKPHDFKTKNRGFDDNPCQQLKSIECYLYQCNEGECHNSPYFRELTKLAETLRRRIIEELSDYQSAKWDI